MQNFLVKDKFLDLSKSFRKFYILAIGIFLTLLTIAVYQNIFTAITLSVCTIVTFVIISLPNRDVNMVLNDQGVKLDQVEINWENCLGFSVVDLGDTLEFVIQTTSVTYSHLYFYLPEENQQVQAITNSLSQFLPYIPELSRGNLTHQILRYFGLK